MSMVMKLRIRSSETRETLKIQVPNPCTLPQLNQILSQTLPNHPLPASIRLSLNQKEDLHSDGDESLQSLGITSGDLIFYSLHPPPTPIAGTSSNPQITISINPNSESKSDSTNLIPQITLPLNPKTVLNSDPVLDSDMDDVEDDGIRFDNYGFSVPGFLRKVFVEELGDDSGRHHKLIVMAVHAVLLESGFVAIDPKSRVVSNGFRVSRMFTLSLFYTLPELVAGEISVVLKFSTLGKFVTVYGTLLGGKSEKSTTCSVRLNEDYLVPFLNVIWANCGVTGNLIGQDGSFSGTSPEKEVFEFWRTVKDKIALPLLIDVCEEAGLSLPPCFTRIPTDLKLKIFEFLPGVDLERVSCVCSELQYLASNDDLWKIKYAEEFGNEGMEVVGSWRKAYSRAWVRKNDRKRLSGDRRAPYWPEARGIRYRRPPILPRFPHNIIGGEHDIWPGFGGFGGFGSNMQTGLHGSRGSRGRIMHSNYRES